MTRAARAVVTAIAAYQGGVSPFLPRACRFVPSCSEYLRLAVLAHGLGRGAWLGVRRLARCHPFHPGGFDPPPPVAAPRA
jgi:uncharacterized protein